MEDILAQKYLTKRPGSENWYFRKRIPTPLLDHYKEDRKGKSVMRSLGTPDKKKAISKLKIELAKLEADFIAIARSLEKAKVSLPSKPFQRQLEDLTSAEREAIVLRWLNEEDSRNNSEENSLLTRASDFEIEEIVENLRIEQTYFAQDAERQDFIGGQSTAREVLLEKGISQGKNHKAFLEFSRLFNVAHNELLERSIKRLQHSPEATLHDLMLSKVYQSLTEQNQITFGEVCEGYKPEAIKKMKKQLSIEGMEAELSLLQQIIPAHTPIYKVDRKAAREAYNAICHLPRNVTKKYAGIPVLKAIELAKTDNAPILGPARMSTYLERLKAVFTYAVNEHYIDKTPFDGLSIIDDREDEDLRDPFTKQQLEKLFKAPLYTGCKNDKHGYMKPGNQFPRRARFWVPLIALWSGMRLEEICQLYVSDVSQTQDIPTIIIQNSVVADDKSLKTSNAKRTVPIHPELVKIGFLKYVEEIKAAGHVNLFPELKRGSNGKLGHPMSKWFRRFLDNLKIKTEKTNFHSFRHTLAQGLKAEDTPEQLANFLCGWKDTSMYSRYSKGESVPVVYEYLKKVSYPGLDLSHLHLKQD